VVVAAANKSSKYKPDEKYNLTIPVRMCKYIVNTLHGQIKYN